MRVSSAVAVLAGACLAAAVPTTPAPAAPTLMPRRAHGAAETTTASGLAPTDAVWVEVNADGKPEKTHTPSQTVVDGTTLLVDAPPYEVTGTVFTEYHPDRTVFATRLPQPKTDGAGAFPLCTATAGLDGSPFCWPREGDTLYVDTRYYVIWDPKLFDEKKIIYSSVATTTATATATTSTTSTSASSTSSAALAARASESAEPTEPQISAILYRTVRIRGERVNRTNNDDELLFISDEMPGTQGVYTLKINNKYMDFKHPTNLSLTLVTTLDGAENEYRGPIVTMKYRPAHGHSDITSESREMYIVLPIICILVIVMGVAMIVYNRKIRRIGFGNIMGRNRGRNRTKGGYELIGGGRKKRGGQQKVDEDGIPLMDGYDSSNDDEADSSAAAEAKGKRKFRNAQPSPFDDYPPHIRATMGAYRPSGGSSRNRYSADSRQAKRD